MCIYVMYNTEALTDDMYLKEMRCFTENLSQFQEAASDSSSGWIPPIAVGDPH